jgi:hypothetical protein
MAILTIEKVHYFRIMQKIFEVHICPSVQEHYVNIK